jgi:hypothetical protein
MQNSFLIEKYPLLFFKEFNNIKIKNLLPVEISIINQIYFDYKFHYFHYPDINENQQNHDLLNNNFVNLENETYIIINNKWVNHIYHFTIECIPTLEFYLNYFNNYKIICSAECFNNEIFQIIINLFNLKDKLLVMEWNKIYRGNFKYLFMMPRHSENIKRYSIFKLNNNLPNNLNNNCLWQNKDEQIIIKKLIDESNKKYKDKIETYDRIWISRRNLPINNGVRYCTNFEEVTHVFLENNFKELHFGVPEIDFLQQIFLVNNAKIIFAETGSSFININFMKENSLFITNNDICTPVCNEIIQAFCEFKNVNLKIINNSILCSERLHEIHSNQPYKISNTNDFINLFNDTITSL